MLLPEKHMSAPRPICAQLLAYDPLTIIQPGTPGYGAGR